MKRHLLLHSDDPTPFACDNCDKKFDRKYRFDKHIKTTHEVSPGNDTVSITENVISEPEKLISVAKATENIEMESVTEEELASKVAEEIASSLEEGTHLDDAVDGDDAMEFNTSEAIAEEDKGVDEEEGSDASGNLSKDHEQLLSDRKKLLEELSTMEDLDFLNNY